VGVFLELPQLNYRSPLAGSTLACQIIKIKRPIQQMPNLENIFQNSLFHYIDIYFLKKLISQKNWFLFRIVVLPTLLVDYGIRYNKKWMIFL
jgi:hypothetical protein